MFSARVRSGVVDVGVLVYLGAAGGDVFRSAGKTGAVIRVIEVVVDGLGDANL
mgnify:CR=1 FL=1